jgi:hypothetical protein
MNNINNIIRALELLNFNKKQTRAILTLMELDTNIFNDNFASKFKEALIEVAYEKEIEEYYEDRIKEQEYYENMYMEEASKDRKVG